MYSLFAMPVFLAMLTFIIVRFRAFNIKLLGAQALVWALIILVGSQFLYMQDMPVSALVLTAVTLVFSSVLGLLVVRSVKKVDQQRELLAIANQNQQTLLHFVTHQVKGYITKSRNIFDGLIAKDYGDLPPKALEMVQHGFDSDTRAVETVMAILKASDLKTGKTEFKKEKTNISALVADVIEFRKDQAEQKGLELTFDIEPNIEIQVDSIQIKEVFKNLVTNSILYTPKGTVHVVLKRELGKVRFAVIDTGVGITPTDKARLFTEGGKGENSTTHNVDSTGYGLYIAKQIVERHQGTVGVISEGKDKGSEFFVLLPDVG
jgi:signal transduction histidine kinase